MRNPHPISPLCSSRFAPHRLIGPRQTCLLAWLLPHPCLLPDHTYASERETLLCCAASTPRMNNEWTLWVGGSAREMVETSEWEWRSVVVQERW